IITYGALVQRSLVAAKQMEQEGISVEIIDLRSLVPFDWNAIAETVKKTNRVIVAHEDSLSFGYGAEIAARISSELFEHLDAPVRRVCAMDTFVAYAPQLEDVILPQVADVAKAIAEMKGYYEALLQGDVRLCWSDLLVIYQLSFIRCHWKKISCVIGEKRPLVFGGPFHTQKAG